MDVAIIGIGLHPFGRNPQRSGLEQGEVAVRAALADAGCQWQDVQIAFGGSTDAGNADALTNHLGQTGIPFINVANGCATGGSALLAAASAIRSGQADVALAVGFDKHDHGAFKVDPQDWGLPQWYGELGLCLTTQFFAMKIQRYMHEFGISEHSLAQVAAKNFSNGWLNPNAWRRGMRALTYGDVLDSPMVSYPLRKYMFCSPAEGGAALVLCRSDKARQFQRRPVQLKSAVIQSKRAGAFDVFSPYLVVDSVPSASQVASRLAFEEAGLGPEDIDVAQLQDTESGAEIMHMAENGFCDHGEQEKWLAEGRTELGGRLPVNTDGGCLANGEPIGASGLRQVVEICTQLRGEAGERQVPNQPKVGYTHVYGAPGLAGVSILQV
ncbi:MAG: thiolase family protein [Pseudomonadales bacterium]|nr:thiolase family protein [Pseudomonadales bacterium]